MKPWSLTASEALVEIRSGNLTVEAYVTSILERLRQRNDAVRAWAYLDEDFILEQAKELDKVPVDKRGPLHGLPIAVKDVIYTKGTYIDVMHIRAGNSCSH